jgi:hypothetical protein
MGRVCVQLHKKGVSVVLATEEEYNELIRNGEVTELLNMLANKYLSDVMGEIEKLSIKERQKLLAEILIMNKLSEAINLSLGKMYDEGVLEEA